MIDHPKYTLCFEKKYETTPFVIYEHAEIDGKVASRYYMGHASISLALKQMGELSTGPVILAMSAQAIDNVHDLSKD